MREKQLISGSPFAFKADAVTYNAADCWLVVVEVPKVICFHLS